ncbi:UNVERIFIED_CONTAM: hypothetical protein GTU68_000873, partial [Idotea baltica]|nr:hypothetical protein [Idotea baltica]
KHLTPELKVKYENALKDAIHEGDTILKSGGTALAAVEAAVVSLENFELFNAGKGSVFTAVGTHEMDASIMCGRTKDAGAIAAVTGVKNPISLAAKVLNHSEHVFLIGEGALEFGRLYDTVFESEDYFFSEFRHKQWQKVKGTIGSHLDHNVDIPDKKFGTVGAVALDSHGNIAAATSTGGMTNKSFGRVGDSPMIGAGNYANNSTCAVSCTGDGEFFIRGVVAYDISAMIEFGGKSLQEACQSVIQHRMKEIGGEGGVIAIDAEGNICLEFNSAGMYRASKNNDEEVFVKIFQ